MKTDSDAALQRFRQAVYERFSTSNTAKSQIAADSIKRRTESFLDWQTTTSKTIPVGAISDDLLRDWVAADIAVFKNLSTTEQPIAATHIGKNFFTYPAYTEILQKVDIETATLIIEMDSTQKKLISSSLEKAKKQPLIASLQDTSEATNKEKIILNGFNGSNITPSTCPIAKENASPEQMISTVLESVTHKALANGSVLYMVNSRPAFIDHGEQILMEPDADNDEESILAAVLLAKEKYRGSFELTGTEEFKRRALEVMLKYNVDAKLKNPQQDALRRELAKTIHQSAKSISAPLPVDTNNGVIASVPASEKEVSKATNDAIPTELTSSSLNNAPQKINHLEGKVIKHGEDHYANNKENQKSYFINIEKADGCLSTIWGVDLERVIQEKKISVGDSVYLKNKGKELVEVEQNIKDKQGKVIGTERITTHRNTWDAKILAKADIEPTANLNTSESKPSIDKTHLGNTSNQQCIASSLTAAASNTSAVVPDVASTTHYELRRKRSRNR